MNELFTPSLSHRFLVSFFIPLVDGVKVPSPVDMRFQRVTGLNREISVRHYQEGGNNTESYYFPENVTHSPLVFERGVTTITPLTMSLESMFTDFQMKKMDIMVMLLNEHSLPVSSWTVTGATPSRWSVGELDAHSNTVLMNTLEFNYQDIYWLGVKA